MSISLDPNKPTTQPLESYIERKVVEYARHFGVEQLKLNVQGRRGWPDRLFVFDNGQHVYIEFKRPGGAVRASQLAVHRKLLNRKCHVYICDAITDGIVIIDAYLGASSLPAGSDELSAKVRRSGVILRSWDGEDKHPLDCVQYSKEARTDK